MSATVPHLMHKPLIGISTSEFRTPDRVYRDPDAEPPQRELALGLDYPIAVTEAQGLPVVLPPQLDVAVDLIGRLDGLLLSGGPDIDPTLYAEPPHPELGPIEPATDRWELALLHAAMARDIPVLAICRGMQLVNVAHGGSLYQDIPSELGLHGHRQEERGSQTTHDVTVEPGTQLAAIAGDGTLAVNSFHHQAVKTLGKGLQISAYSHDGLVEALEAPGREFLMGVQWHNESLYPMPRQMAVFTEFMTHATRHAR